MSAMNRSRLEGLANELRELIEFVSAKNTGEDCAKKCLGFIVRNGEPTLHQLESLLAEADGEQEPVWRDAMRSLLDLAQDIHQQMPGVGEKMVELLRIVRISQPTAAHNGEQPVQAGEMDRSAPERVWLQVDTDGDPEDRGEPIPRESWPLLSWCYESIGGQEVEYVRADLAAPQARAEVTDEMVDVAVETYRATNLEGCKDLDSAHLLAMRTAPEAALAAKAGGGE